MTTLAAHLSWDVGCGDCWAMVVLGVLGVFFAGVLFVEAVRARGRRKR